MYEIIHVDNYFVNVLHNFIKIYHILIKFNYRPITLSHIMLMHKHRYEQPNP